MNKQEFSASNWKSNQGYTKMLGQPVIKVFCCLHLEVHHMQFGGTWEENLLL